MNNEPLYDLFNPAPEPIEMGNCMNSFGAGLSQIDGLIYKSSFISFEEEKELISIINEQEWLGDLKRRVQHYGWKYDYRARALNYNMFLGPLPSWIKAIAERLVDNELMDQEADQVIINEYRPGQGIANHIDCEPCFGDTIVSLSLGSPCVMNFINVISNEKKVVVLHNRSVVVIKGESRYKWSHGIPARLADEIDGVRRNRSLRISMTFRKVIL